jgi:hypothetical protein
MPELPLENDETLQTTYPLTWQPALTEAVKNAILRTYKDSKGGKHIIACLMLGINPYTNPATLELPVVISDPLTPTNQVQVIPTSSWSGGILNGNTHGTLIVTAMQGVLNGSGNMDCVKEATWFSGAVSCTTVAATQIVAGVAGKTHRILGGVIICAGGLAAAGTEVISILDVAADFGLDFGTYLPIAASLTGLGITVIPIQLPPNGHKCAAVNTAINVTLSAAITAGAIYVSLWGDDE